MRAEAELLADAFGAAIDRIAEAAGVVILPSAEYLAASPRVRELGDRYQRHMEAVAHVGARAVTELFKKTLAVAARARGENLLDG